MKNGQPPLRSDHPFQLVYGTTKIPTKSRGNIGKIKSQQVQGFKLNIPQYSILLPLRHRENYL